MTITGTFTTRNDNYRGDLRKRFLISVQSLLNTCDELFLIDWASEGKMLAEDMYDELPHTGRLKSLRVTPTQADELVKHQKDVLVCNTLLGFNIAARRVSGDWMIMTSVDCVAPVRSTLERLVPMDPRTFYAIAKHEINISDFPSYESIADLQLKLEPFETKTMVAGPSGAYPGDIWSLINCCGDFQMCTTKLMCDIKGVEEWMVGRGFGDSNVQRKAVFNGYKIEAISNVPVYHMAHPGFGFGGQSGRLNDAYRALGGFRGTENTENWGGLDYNFEIITI